MNTSENIGRGKFLEMFARYSLASMSEGCNRLEERSIVEAPTNKVIFVYVCKYQFIHNYFSLLFVCYLPFLYL